MELSKSQLRMLAKIAKCQPLTTYSSHGYWTSPNLDSDCLSGLIASGHVRARLQTGRQYRLELTEKGQALTGEQGDGKYLPGSAAAKFLGISMTAFNYLRQNGKGPRWISKGDLQRFDPDAFYDIPANSRTGKFFYARQSLLEWQAMRKEAGMDLRPGRLTTAEAAAMLGMDAKQLTDLRARDRGPAWFRQGSHVFYDSDAVKRWRIDPAEEEWRAAEERRKCREEAS